MAENNGKRLQQKEPKQKKEKKPSRLTRTQKGLLAVAILLAIALVCVVAMKSLFVKPDLPGKGNARQTGADAEQEEYIDYGDGVQPKVDGARKSQDYYTVLILGRDTGGGGNTDTMLLASYDVTNQKATVMSIPRDTMVNVSWDVKKINSVYNMNGGGDKGIKALYKEISQLVGFEPDYQVIVEWEAVGKIVDAIGGVDFDVPYPMDYHDPYQDLVIEQAAGLRHLSGDDAMQVIRWRKNDADSPYGYNKGGIGDSGRMELQQNFLKAVIKQMMQPKNVLNIGKIAKVFEESVETDLSFQNILWFGKQAFSGGLSLDNVTFLTMPWKGAYAWSRSYKQNLDYVVPIAGQLLDIVNNQLSPFAETFKLSDLDIMSVNADGSLSSTTGRVEDSVAAQPPEKNTEETVYLLDEFGNYLDPVTGEIVYYTDTNGNVIRAATGEAADKTPASTPKPTTETPDTGTPDSPTEDPGGTTVPPDSGETGIGGEDPGSGELPVIPEDPPDGETPGMIVVPVEPTDAEANSGMPDVDPVTGEPLPFEG